ncbi:hypothetical protein glysoja_032640 [Glycine soja]|uniref:Uncharacterized protein n=1 Tax=Glycine soja TaxID=3848 RepID=A0A0B2SNY3_GLYSO|nr:hypothetical protein glysoja_032640 [Glycine soja]
MAMHHPPRKRGVSTTRRTSFRMERCRHPADKTPTLNRRTTIVPIGSRRQNQEELALTISDQPITQSLSSPAATQIPNKVLCTKWGESRSARLLDLAEGERKSIKKEMRRQR